MTDTERHEADWTMRFAALSVLEPSARHRLRQHARRLELPAGARVFSPGDPCSAWLLVESGAIRVQMTADTGREILLYRVEPGESCVLTTACLLGQDVYSAEGLVESDAVGIAVPTPVFRRLLDDYPTFRDMVFMGFGRRITDILMTLEDAVFHRIDERLARLLLRRGGDGGFEATHQDLAVDLGSAREVVSRQLKAFERGGLIGLERGRISLRDRAGLQRMARDDV